MRICEEGYRGLRSGRMGMFKNISHLARSMALGLIPGCH